MVLITVAQGTKVALKERVKGRTVTSYRGLLFFKTQATVFCKTFNFSITIKNENLYHIHYSL